MKYKIKKVLALMLVMAVIYVMVCICVQIYMFSEYNLTYTYDRNGYKYSPQCDILKKSTGSALEACYKKLEDIYLNNTSDSQSILKYRSCELTFDSDNDSDHNNHYANLKINFDIQERGKFFFPLEFIKGNKTAYIVNTVNFEENEVMINTKKEIEVNNFSDYHKGDIVELSANDINSKEYIIKGVVNHINNGSVYIDFEDASIDYSKLKFDTNSLKRVSK